eukprot:454856-Pleurochrysis_carterae.AAC.1
MHVHAHTGESCRTFSSLRSTSKRCPFAPFLLPLSLLIAHRAKRQRGAPPSDAFVLSSASAHKTRISGG